MIIGTRSVDEARIFDSHEGMHRVEGFSFEVFFHDGSKPILDGDDPAWREYAEADAGGWYWHAVCSGCLPDSDPVGPFATSTDAYDDAVSADFADAYELSADLEGANTLTVDLTLED